jgi:hypothetical protein
LYITYIFITVLTDEQKEMLHDLVDPTAKFFEVSAIYIVVYSIYKYFSPDLIYLTNIPKPRD